MQVFPLAAAFVGYVVLWNLSLQLNPVGFYQLAKILIAPAVIAIEASFYAKRPTRNELLAVCVLCVGVTMATITDDQARPAALPLPGVSCMSGSCGPRVGLTWRGSRLELAARAPTAHKLSGLMPECACHAGGHQSSGPGGGAARGVLHGGVPDLGGREAEGAGRGQHAAHAPVCAACDRPAGRAGGDGGAAGAAGVAGRRVRP